MKILEQLKQTKLYKLVMEQKYLSMIIGASVLMLFIVIVLSISQSVNKQSQAPSLPPGVAQLAPTGTAQQQGFSLPNLFSLFTQQKPTPTSALSTPGSSGPVARVTIAPQSSSISSFGGKALTGTTSTGASIVASNTVSNSSTTQGSSGTNGTSGSGGSSSGGSSSSSSTTPGVPTPTPRPDILILFENPNGTVTNYIPPGTPPTEVKWGRYTSYQDNYAIDYPVNWQIEVTNVDGHQGVAVFAPGTNKNTPGTPYIGFGLTPTYFHVAQAQLANAFDTDIFVGDIQGTLYTDGSLGNSYIASLFPYQNGNFGLGSNSSDVTFAYVYYFMLHSLRFNVQ